MKSGALERRMLNWDVYNSCGDAQGLIKLWENFVD